MISALWTYNLAMMHLKHNGREKVLILISLYQYLCSQKYILKNLLNLEIAKISSVTALIAALVLFDPTAYLLTMLFVQACMKPGRFCTNSSKLIRSKFNVKRSLLGHDKETRSCSMEWGIITVINKRKKICISNDLMPGRCAKRNFPEPEIALISTH